MCHARDMNHNDNRQQEHMSSASYDDVWCVLVYHIYIIYAILKIF